MPIYDENQTAELVTPLPATTPAPQVSMIRTSSPTYNSVTVDNRWTPTNTLLQHVEGSSWVVDYYSQIIGLDSNLKGQQTSTSAAYQQYNKIEKLEIKVISPLVQTQDPETKAQTLSGTALLYSMLVPNEGDMFIANIDNGQLSTFRVISSTKKSIFKQATYEITYSIGTTDPVYLLDLYSKVINTYVYRKDFLTYGQNPVVISEDNAILETLENVYKTLADQYFPRFYNKEFKTFTLPGQTQATYDPFLTGYILKMFGMRDHHILQEVRELNVDDDPVMTQNNIWTALMNKDVSYLNTGFTRTGLVSTVLFSYNPFVNPIRYTGISYCVYPIDPVLMINSAEGNIVKQIDATNVLIEAPGGSLTMPLNDNLANLPATSIPAIYPVTVDDNYVLSNNFYTQNNSQSTLELVVSDFLMGRALNIKQLSNSAKLFTQWGLLEQYYYVPILLTLIRGCIRSY